MDDERSIMRGTGAGLLEFCDRAGERGDIGRETARGYRIAAGKVLAIESADLGSIDVRSLDIGDVLDRFCKRNKADFSEGSLSTYRSRFRLAVAMYLAWLDDDPNWKMAGREARGTHDRGTARASSSNLSRARMSSPARSAGPASRPAGPVNQPVALDPAEDAPSSVRLITYDVPLRPDLIVRVTLPVDLTRDDADRLAAFIGSLAFSDRNASDLETRSAEGSEVMAGH